MTILAQLHDCHGCNDERSIVQKKKDWIQLPVERYLTALPTLKQGVIAGVFKNKGAAPWAITKAEKLQLSVFLPNDLSMDDWYAGVYSPAPCVA